MFWDYVMLRRHRQPLNNYPIDLVVQLDNSSRWCQPVVTFKCRNAAVTFIQSMKDSDYETYI